MIDNLSCRVAIQSDLNYILDLYAQPDFDAGRVLALDQAITIFKRFQLYPDYQLYVAEVGNTIVGSFALLIMDNLGHLGSPSAILEDVVVAPTHQSMGLGSAMLRYAFGLARNKSCYKIFLSSNMRRTRAHDFYHDLGFKQHGYSFFIDLNG
jgi:GNAT superfamily N-acetyltransferase